MIATRQHGVVSIRQLESLSFTRSAITREVAAGRLHHVHRGVYAVGHERLSWHGYCLAAVLANAPAAVAGHFSAGWLWGLLLNRPSGEFHVTSPTRRHRKDDFHVHRAVLALPGTRAEGRAAAAVDALRRRRIRARRLLAGPPLRGRTRRVSGSPARACGANR